MNRPGVPWSASWLGVVALGLVPFHAPAAQPHPPLRKLHALLVIDSTSDLKQSVVEDGKHMTELLRAGLPGGHLDLTELRGADVTANNILTHFERLSSGPDEAILFYYAGHGATDPIRGPYFQLRGGAEELFRSRLIQVMEAGQPGLVVLLTDCCSTLLPAHAKSPKRALEEIDAALFRQLFLQHRGRVDVTAATDDAAIGDLDGGLFTRVLRGMLLQKAAQLDQDKNGFVSWREFFPQLQHRTEEEFQNGPKRGPRGEQRLPDKQRPRAFQLPEDGLSPTPALAVVSLYNPSSETVRFRVRWAGDGEWQQKQLGPKEKTQFTRRLAADARAVPDLELQPDGETEITRHKPNRWTGSDEPDFHSGEKYVYVRPKK